MRPSRAARPMIGPVEAAVPAVSGRHERAGHNGTRLSGRALYLVRAGWLAVVVLLLGLLVFAIPAELTWQLQTAERLYRPALAQLSLTPAFYATFCTALDAGLVLVFAITGIIMFWRRSDDWMVLLIGLTGMTFAALFIPTMVFLMRLDPAWRLPVGFLRGVGLATSLIGPYYLFPDGRFIPRVTRWLTLLWTAAVLAWLVWPNLPINLLYVDTWSQQQGLAFAVYAGVYATGVAAQFYRYYWRSGPVEREQTRWVVFGITAGFVSYCIYQGPPLLFPSLTQPGTSYLFYIFFWRPVYYFLIALVPICIGIAILRHRLWNIDLIIRRTLIYGVLTGLLVLFYAGSVLLLQQAFRLIAGQGSVPAIVTSTLALAVLFQPLRGRVQLAIDRRFYRRKYDSARVLASFSVTVRDEVDLDVVTEQLLQAVEETIQPAYISLWLNERASGQPLQPL